MEEGAGGVLPGSGGRVRPTYSHSRQPRLAQDRGGGLTLIQDALAVLRWGRILSVCQGTGISHLAGVVCQGGRMQG
eukprot:365902-Chlamydomonas_euryale.AAC.9